MTRRHDAPSTGALRLDRAHALVLAKAPVAGRVKTRLGADVGLGAAAEVAAASLLDTVRACTDAFGAARCHLALAGDLADAVRGEELLAAIDGWSVLPQRGEALGARIAFAHADVVDLLAGRGEHEGITVQIGMDTPQVSASDLGEAARAVVGGEHEAALGPAEDGGWWVLAMREPGRAAALADVPMSTPTTYDDTRAALVAAGLSVVELRTLRDVDTVADAEAIVVGAPDSEFSRAWSEVAGPVVAGSGR